MPASQGVQEPLGQWREEQARTANIFNPQSQQQLDKVHSQILERTDVDAQVYRVMLSPTYKLANS